MLYLWLKYMFDIMGIINKCEGRENGVGPPELVEGDNYGGGGVSKFRLMGGFPQSHPSRGNLIVCSSLLLVNTRKLFFICYTNQKSIFYTAFVFKQCVAFETKIY